jgi:hypothetical protein
MLVTSTVENLILQRDALGWLTLLRLRLWPAHHDKVGRCTRLLWLGPQHLGDDVPMPFIEPPAAGGSCTGGGEHDVPLVGYFTLHHCE